MAEHGPRQVLRNALVVDGSLSTPRRVDVEIAGDRIGRIGTIPLDASAPSVDLGGLVLAPGFVDTHTHFDAQVFWDPNLTPSSWHGVTTAVIGNCGFGFAPTRPADRDEVMETLKLVEGMNFETLKAGIVWSFETWPDYANSVAALHKRINVCGFVPHSAVRTYVMGPDAATSQHADDRQLGQMQSILRDALDAGAIGFSTSQAPSHVGARGRAVPSRSADEREIRALLSIMAEAGSGIAQITYGPVYDIDDVARLSKEYGVRITWGSLLTHLFGPGGACLPMLERAAAVGADFWPQISCREIINVMSLDRPYFIAQSAAMREALALPFDARPELYGNPEWRLRAAAEIEIDRPGLLGRTSVDETQLFPELRGRRLVDIAAERGCEPIDVLCDLSLAESQTTRFRFAARNFDPVELTALVRDRRTVLGAHDAGAHVDMLNDACFPTHMLGHWVRDTGVLPIEEAVWRLSGQPAELFCVAERGFVRQGYAADLVAFDPQTVAPGPDRRVHDFPANGERIISDSIGIEHLWVAGTQTRRAGCDIESAKPGRFVKRAGS